MTTRAAFTAFLVVTCLLGCARSPSSTPAVGSKTSRSSAQTIDELFRNWENERPEPVALSEQNGFTVPCLKGHATFNLLKATAAKVPIRNDADLIPVAKWARHPDPCIRQIALQAIVPSISYDANELSIPGMYDVEHYQFHDIFVSLQAHFVRKKVAYDPSIFEGMFVTPDTKGFHAYLDDNWVQAIDENSGVQEFVAIDSENVRVTSRHLPVDVKFPDHTQTTKIRNIVANEKQQYVLTGAWNIESNSAGYRGPKNEPAQFVYSFWPVKDDVMWFKNGATAYWIKMRRSPR
jgi:hypothetical protein